MQERLENLDDKLDRLLSRTSPFTRLFERSMSMVERVSTSGGLKYVAGTTVALAALPVVLAALLLTLAGTGWELRWGDLHLGATRTAPAAVPAPETP